MLKVHTEADAQAVDMAGALDVANLPTETFAGLRRLPVAAAVYFVLHKGGVLYIGATVNLRLRWKDHPRRRVLRNGGRVAWLLVDVDMLRSVERAMIHEFSPPLNNHHTEIGRGVRGQGIGGAGRALKLLMMTRKANQ